MCRTNTAIHAVFSGPVRIFLETEHGNYVRVSPVKLLGITMIGYGFLKGQLYRKSQSKTGRRLGLFIALFYILAGMALLIVER